MRQRCVQVCFIREHPSGCAQIAAVQQRQVKTAADGGEDDQMCVICEGAAHILRPAHTLHMINTKQRVHLMFNSDALHICDEMLFVCQRKRHYFLHCLKMCRVKSIIL